MKALTKLSVAIILISLCSCGGGFNNFNKQKFTKLKQLPESPTSEITDEPENNEPTYQIADLELAPTSEIEVEETAALEDAEDGVLMDEDLDGNEITKRYQITRKESRLTENSSPETVTSSPQARGPNSGLIGLGAGLMMLGIVLIAVLALLGAGSLATIFYVVFAILILVGLLLIIYGLKS